MEEHGEAGGDDPFARWTLDEAFVRSAPRTEAAADERVARTRDLRQWQRDQEDDRAQARRASRRRVRRRCAVALLGVVAGGTAISLLGGSTSAERSLGGRDPAWRGGEVTAFPSPAEVAREPLGAPIDPPPEPGPFAFLAEDGGRPVAYDPCRSIAVVVNDRAAPPGSEELLEGALAEVSRITGLRFEVEGPSDEVPAERRPPFQEERYGDRWAPVLVAWSDPAEASRLAGDVAGYAGSSAVARFGSPTVYVTGVVVLDGPALGDLLDEERGAALAESVIRHELGHLVGLDHVDDAGELMAPESDADTTSFGPGDVAGLVRLGSGPCAPGL